MEKEYLSVPTFIHVESFIVGPIPWSDYKGVYFIYKIKTNIARLLRLSDCACTYRDIIRFLKFD